VGDHAGILSAVVFVFCFLDLHPPYPPYNRALLNRQSHPFCSTDAVLSATDFGKPTVELAVKRTARVVSMLTDDRSHCLTRRSPKSEPFIDHTAIDLANFSVRGKTLQVFDATLEFLLRREEFTK
jgi:hypothetical protein